MNHGLSILKTNCIVFVNCIISTFWCLALHGYFAWYCCFAFLFVTLHVFSGFVSRLFLNLFLVGLPLFLVLCLYVVILHSFMVVLPLCIVHIAFFNGRLVSLCECLAHPCGCCVSICSCLIYFSL